MPKSIVVGNWKMHGSRDAVAGFAAAWQSLVDDVDVVLAPPFPYVADMSAALPVVGLAGQDCSAHLEGAFTGEVSASMLVDVGCKWVILGHSERRQHHGESDDLVAAKVAQAQKAGLTPIVCVGETLAQRESGEHEAVVAQQVLGSLDGADLSGLAIAYEPVWAIGTGVTATPEQAEAMHRAIRDLLTERFGESGQALPLLYGGSVKPENAAALFACANIDGALVGGASLKAADFAAIVDAAR
jgi:triosephosphate isomerase